MQALRARDGIRIAWWILSAGSLAVLVAPFLMPQEWFSTLPVCEWKAKYNRECGFCGMTTAFFAIADGRFSDALNANRGSLVLYGSLVLNQICALLVWWRR